MEKRSRIPCATIERIAQYLRPLESLLEEGAQVISSGKLAEMCRVNPAQVRKDLSFFGEFGVRGVGYDVHDLVYEIKKILASDREWKLGLVGVGDLGRALIQHKNFMKRGYQFVAAFDSDPKKIGKELPFGLKIQSVSEIEQEIHRSQIEIGVITTPISESQKIAELLFNTGIMAILNFSSIHIKTPDCCLVQNVDFTYNLDHLVFQLSKNN